MNDDGDTAAAFSWAPPRQAAAEERKAAAKKKDEDQKIIFMDTSALDDTQRAYVEAMRAKILAEILGGSRGGSV